MEKDTALASSASESSKVTLLPYSTPELFIYNSAEVTRGGAIGPRAADFTCTPITNYRIS